MLVSHVCTATAIFVFMTFIERNWLIAFLPALVLLPLAYRLQRIALRERARHARRVQESRQAFARDFASTQLDSAQEFCLYLRPFAVDGTLYAKRKDGAIAMFMTVGVLGFFTHQVVGIVAFLALAFGLGNRLELEDDLANNLSEVAPLFALSAVDSVGALKLTTSNEEWKSMVEQLACRSKAIFLVPGAYEGTLWEIDLIRRNGLQLKTFMICPPGLGRNHDPEEQGLPNTGVGWPPSLAKYWGAAQAALWERFEMHLPPLAPAMIFRMTAEGGFEAAMPLGKLKSRLSLEALLSP